MHPGSSEFCLRRPSCCKAFFTELVKKMNPEAFDFFDRCRSRPFNNLRKLTFIHKIGPLFSVELNLCQTSPLKRCLIKCLYGGYFHSASLIPLQGSLWSAFGHTGCSVNGVHMFVCRPPCPISTLGST